MFWLAILMVVVVLSASIAALFLKNWIAATVSASVVSLGVAGIFVLLRAPDVAMTEAAVGAGLSSILLALAMKPLGLWQIEVQQEEKDQ